MTGIRLKAPGGVSAAALQLATARGARMLTSSPPDGKRAKREKRGRHFGKTCVEL
jgi:NADPH:quinone reductase-like Zn-dependent oxidoreductase